MNLEIITELSNHFKMVDDQIKRMENYKIEKLLEFLNVPKKGENLISIEQCLKWDNIGIYLPSNIFKTINFNLLTLPKKVKFHSNLHDDKIYVFNQKAESKWPYPAQMDKKSYLNDISKMDLKIDIPFFALSLFKDHPK